VHDFLGFGLVNDLCEGPTSHVLAINDSLRLSRGMTIWLGAGMTVWETADGYLSIVYFCKLFIGRYLIFHLLFPEH
jgi:hypothetical protein